MGEEKEWQKLSKEEKDAKLASLVSLDELCKHLDMTSTEVYWMMSTRKLPGWLVGGKWKFDQTHVDGWVERIGGLKSAQTDVRAQIAKHRAAQG